MNIFFFIISLIIFTKTVSYSIFEIKKQNNTLGGIVLLIISFLIFVTTNFLVRIR